MATNNFTYKLIAVAVAIPHIPLHGSKFQFHRGKSVILVCLHSNVMLNDLKLCFQHLPFSNTPPIRWFSYRITNSKSFREETGPLCSFQGVTRGPSIHRVYIVRGKTSRLRMYPIGGGCAISWHIWSVCAKFEIDFHAIVVVSIEDRERQAAGEVPINLFSIFEFQVRLLRFQNVT